MDAADIDRYLSGRPSRDQESGAPAEPRGRRSDTASQLDQLQHAVDSQQTRRQPRQSSVGRQQFVEPEPDEQADWYDEYDVEGGEYDDPYDDGYVDDYDDYAPPPEPRRPRSQPPRRRQPSRSAQEPRGQARPPAIEDEYDEELYADDPYLTYTDDEDLAEPAPRRAQRQRQQSRPRATRPNMPRFSVPPSISQSEIANDIPSLAMFGGAILSAAVMAIVVSNRVELLPGVIPTHVSASGVPENLTGRNAIWSIPLLSVALLLMNFGAAWFVARLDLFAARFLLGGALLVQLIAWVAVIEYLW